MWSKPVKRGQNWIFIPKADRGPFVDSSCDRLCINRSQTLEFWARHISPARQRNIFCSPVHPFAISLCEKKDIRLTKKGWPRGKILLDSRIPWQLYQTSILLIIKWSSSHVKLRFKSIIELQTLITVSIWVPTKVLHLVTGFKTLGLIWITK